MNDSPFLLAMVARSYVSALDDRPTGSRHRRRDHRSHAWRAATARTLHRLAERLESTDHGVVSAR